jgi:hypothetical protein
MQSPSGICNARRKPSAVVMSDVGNNNTEVHMYDMAIAATAICRTKASSDRGRSRHDHAAVNL